MKKLSLLCLFTLQFFCWADKPNIVFILADDLGWKDVGFNGTEFYETPNLDRLCKSGMKFNRAYSGGANCLPTRACLISGMYTTRTQIWTPGGASKGNKAFMKFKVPVRGGDKSWDTIPSEQELLPSVTSIAEVLKSAGYKTARYGKWHVGQDTQGFDISDPSGKGAPIGKKFYGNINVHEWLTDASVKFIEDNRQSPFFLYLAHWDVHTPIRAKKDVVKKYDQKLLSKDWSRKWNTTYAAMIDAVDLSVKRVHAKLEELGLAENTLFIFSSDNGGHGSVTTNAPLRGAKGAFSEGGVRVPTFMSWPQKIKAGSECNMPITSVDFLPTFAEISKADLPVDQPVDGQSILPLFKGEPLPKRAIFWHYPLYLSGHAESKVVPVFGTENYYWRAVPSTMIIQGEWKLIHYFETDAYQLFNVVNDISESEDLSTKFPEVTQELKVKLRTWQRETKAVIPTSLNEDFNSKVAELKKEKKKKK